MTTQVAERVDPPVRRAPRRPKAVNKTSKPVGVLTYVWLVLAAIVLLFPVLLTVLGGLLPEGQLVRQPPSVFSASHYSFDNYVSAWQQTVVPLLPAFFNSLFVGVVIMLAHLVTSSLAAYALVFVRMPLRKPIFWLFMATIMVPYEAIVVPNALFIRSMGLQDNQWSLVLPFLANGFGVFLMRQAFRQFPEELRHAALIDGAGHFRFLFTIVLPSVRPSLIALSVWSFLQGWNMYFWPLIISSSNNSMNTLQTAVFALKANGNGTQQALLLAGVTITLVPTLLLVVFGQRWLVRGFMAGAVK
ncbi:carbohydrate ABC transporter permease [Labedaea rhizosphaerae]|uniref:Carbohydrate ABC transporter membrane protein 2 (CUT1 family) n=1 Tax=Labedaea rhizosphaerae TaxID=598644 RepID=A0A4R6SJL1_LABRH|nr:carbohydrate ABC transporter permease [Labedaea rhizosphaerae]TDQ04239.1 carbohydrate ABC transporter membrane protein 2 (CUT1 family) [Labedaea rhizosphaerae]